MNDPQLNFFGGLLWYLEIRNWSLEKMRTCPHGSQLFDVRMYHSLYFANLLSAVDHVSDHLKTDKPARVAFIGQVQDDFGDPENRKSAYVRELRNGIVHRGFDPASAAHSDETTLRVLCPPTVSSIKKVNFTCKFRYMDELATHCNTVADAAITSVFNSLDLFNPAKHMVDETDVTAAVADSPAMPDWAKAMAAQAFSETDYPAMALVVATGRVAQMRRLLGQPDV